MGRISRRDFLKISSALSGALAVKHMVPGLPASTSQPSILIIVFDAMSAKNLSVYGYRRNTTPNFGRFAERATVYHQHYSAAPFTTPGTASLFTGLYPWTHRAINESGVIARDRTQDNLFRALGNQYYRLAFSQNLWPNYFFAQFSRDIERRLSPASFSLVSQVVGDKLPHDVQAGLRAFDDFLFMDGQPPPSVVFGLFERVMLRRGYARAERPDYPRGLPRAGSYPIFFALKDVINGFMATISEMKPPSLAYLHAFSPHAPYRPTREFDQVFGDGWRPKPKPEHLLGAHLLPKILNDRRQNYDEYVANVDAEFGRLMDFLDAKGILDHTHVVVTSDHGELFERGVQGHTSSLMYDAVLQVPLLISSPGQRSRRDVNIPTNSIDLLPTLAHLSGGDVPAWCEGQILPGLGGPEDTQRTTYMMDAKENSAFAPLLHRVSFVLRKGPYKLHYYKGYSEYGGNDAFELYDISTDPEELVDLYPQNPSFTKALRDELLTKIDAENARFKR